VARAVDELLAEYERRQHEGDPVTPEALCAGRPGDLTELRRRIERLETCDHLLGLSTTNSDSSDEVPERIGDYEIRGVLGRGGMGVVYRGWDSGLRRPAAVKVIRPSGIDRRVGEPNEVTARFEREREVLGRLEHAHIVPVYTSGLSDGRPYVAMAFMAGGSIRDRFRDLSKQGPRAAASFVEKVACGVHAAHELGVLHRDLKPGNILLDARGEPRVSDFGLAKFWSPDHRGEYSHVGSEEPSVPRAGELTWPGNQPGTPAYMAPEQFDPTFGQIGPATDVWALGVILFELVAGHRPFTTKDNSPLFRQVCYAPTPRCRSQYHRVPRWLQEVISRCLAKQSADRYGSAAALAKALRTGLQRPRRRAWVMGSVAVLAAVLAIGLVGGQWLLSYLKPKTADTPLLSADIPFAEKSEVRSAISDLEDKKEVVLVDETRRAPYRWVFGPETGREVSSDPGCLTLHTKWSGPATAEFLPNLPPGKYRIRAVIKHDLGNDSSKVALYVGGRYWESAAGRHLHCVALHFQDVGPEFASRPKVGERANTMAQFCTLLTGEISSRSSHWDNRPVGNVDFLAAAAANRRADFRTIEFQVSESGVEGWWDGQRAGFVPLAKVMESLNLSRIGYPEKTSIQSDPHPLWGSVGVFVLNGTLSVREFRITPIE
jgi:serine/threonine protein kinase